MKFLNCLFILLLLCSCHKVEKKGIYIDVGRRDKVSIYEVFDSIKIISLETKSESLIKDISRLIVHDNKYYILDRPMSRVLVFDEYGTFISKIDNKGNGPNEYVGLSDFDIDTINHQILLLAPQNRALYKYNENQVFQNRSYLPQIEGAYHRMLVLNTDTIAFWTSDYEKRLKIYSLVSDDIFYETFPEGDVFFNKFSPTMFSHRNYLTRSSSNIVYSIVQNSNLKIAYEWDFGVYNNALSKKIESVSFEDVRSLSQKVFSSEIVNYIFYLNGGNDIYNYTQLIRKNKKINIFYNTKTSSSFVFEKFIEKASIYPIYWTNEYLIGIIDEDEDLENMIPDAILSDENQITKSKIDEFENPILIKYYFKNESK